MADSDQLVSVEKDGRILSGVGVTESDLTATMERHAPDAAMAGPPDASTSTPTAPRAPRGQKRFDQISWEKNEAQRRADAAEQRAKDLEAQLAEARKPSAPPSPQSQQPIPPSL